MFSGIHDSLLVAYSVNSESHELVLSLQPHHGSATSPFSIVFRGLAAHRFEAPQLPAILSDINPISAESLFTAIWPSIERGYKACGWPGSWADTLVNALHFANASSLQGFQIESSYGLSGWVLARSVELAASGP